VNKKELGIQTIIIPTTTSTKKNIHSQENNKYLLIPFHLGKTGKAIFSEKQKKKTEDNRIRRKEIIVESHSIQSNNKMKKKSSVPN
jgi:hypothetical protein